MPLFISLICTEACIFATKLYKCHPLEIRLTFFLYVLVELLGKIGLFAPFSISTVKKATDKLAGKFNKTYRMIPTENSNLV